MHTQPSTWYSQRDWQVHWESSGGPPAARDVWTAVAWRRAALAAAQVCRQKTSALTTRIHNMMNSVWSDLLYLFGECLSVCLCAHVWVGVCLCMCVASNITAGLIFIWEGSCLSDRYRWWGPLTFLLRGAEQQGGLVHDVSAAGANNVWNPQRLLCWQGCQVLFIFGFYFSETWTTLWWVHCF